MSSETEGQTAIARTVVTVPFSYAPVDGTGAERGAEYVKRVLERTWLARGGQANRVWELGSFPPSLRELGPSLAAVFGAGRRPSSEWRARVLRLAGPLQFLQRRLVLHEADGPVRLGEQLQRVDLAVYPVGVAVLALDIRWEIPSAVREAPNGAEHVIDWLAARVGRVRQLRTVGRGGFAEIWSLEVPARPVDRGDAGDGATEHAGLELLPPRLRVAALDGGRISLAELAHWLAAGDDDEALAGVAPQDGAPMREAGTDDPRHHAVNACFAETPMYGWTFTALTLPPAAPRTALSIEQALFRIARGAPAQQLPPPALADHVRFVRANRAFGSWREGVGALNWWEPGLNAAVEHVKWPADVFERYLHLALFLVAERDAVQELCHDVGVLFEEYGAGGGDAAPASAPRLAALLDRLRRHVAFTAAFVVEDSGGNSDVAAFFQLVRTSLRTPALLAEYRAEVEELLRYVDARYEQAQHRVAEHAAAADREFQRRVSTWGFATGVAAVITGAFGMNLELTAGFFRNSEGRAFVALAVVTLIAAGAAGWYGSARLRAEGRGR